MKTTILSLAAAFVLLTASVASAATTGQGGPGRNDNYGYDKNHRVTPQERARWEAQHRNDRHDDKNDRHDDKKGHDDQHDNDHRNDNYGYDKNHRITPQERARWEAQHRNDHR